MANKSRGKVNQPPTGEGKKQSAEQGAEIKLGKRSEVVQAQHDRPDLNVGTDEDEAAATPKTGEGNPNRPKAGR
ncbi:MAG TPA: hypothetical protein VEY11_02255 [Pyrinomonadaceae bacterium]|nr:hypothetical protein [Pyrinomonadaceae bacterium]